MREAWEHIKDRWEWDSVWRDQVLLAVIIGLIGLTFTLAELGARVRWQPAG